MRRLAIGLVLLLSLTPSPTPAGAAPACAPTPRPDPSNPLLVFQRAAFGFHDEELVLCSPGHTGPTHLAARMWVPAACVEPGSCPAVLVAHGFGFNKEITFGDMLNAAQRGMVVLSYDVRGQGASGGQATLLGRDDVADQAAVLAWLHEHVRPTKLGVYGISQGGALALMAAIYNCSPARAAAFDSTAPCDEERWVDAIAPLQGPTSLGSFDDGTCLVFSAQAVPYSRGNATIAAQNLACLARGTPAEGPVATAIAPVPPFDLSTRDLLARADRIDVPATIGTSFNDRLVPPQSITDLYELLRARPDYDEDLRLIVSNDGHGDIGANFAVLDDVFGWLAVMLGASDEPLREAPVAIAQEWDGDAFRLEHAWPIPGTDARALYLDRPSPDADDGTLADAPAGPTSSALQPLPYPDSPPQAPFLGGVRIARDRSVPGLRLTYLGAPVAATVEHTGVPEAAVWVSSSNPTGEGRAQLHVALSEVTADGDVREFARARRGLRGLGATPTEVRLRFNAVSVRLEPGSRLLLSITRSDAAVALPDPGTDLLFVHHGGTSASGLTMPVVPADRIPPEGTPPTGASFLDDPLGTICSFFSAPCP